MNLLVNGCSFTAGTIESLNGDFSKTWPNVTGHNIVDLSMKGSSNDRIVRTTVNYLVDNHPDFVVIQWTLPQRYEYTEDGAIKQALVPAPTDKGIKIYNDQRLLTQIYLIQTLLESKGIPYGFILWRSLHRETYRSKLWSTINTECIINCEGGYIIGMCELLHNNGHKLSNVPIIGHEDVLDKHYMADGHQFIANLVNEYIKDTLDGT